MSTDFPWSPHPPGSIAEAPPQPGNITFSEFYDVTKDPYQVRRLRTSRGTNHTLDQNFAFYALQMKNLWPSLSADKQAVLMAEIEKRFACTGTRDTPSNCE